MKHTNPFIYLLFLWSCSIGQPSNNYENFNEEAKQTFLKGIDSYDLSPLSGAEKCILKKTIENDLDDGNNWKVSLIHDTFVVRSYEGGFLQLGFSFVKDKVSNKYYFLWIPSLKERLYDFRVHYKEKNDTIFELKEPVTAIKLHTPLLDDFFKHPIFHVGPEKYEFFKKKNVARHLLEEAFEDVYKYEVDGGVLLNKMEDLLNKGIISSATYNLVDEKFNKPISTIENYKLETFYIDYAGYIIFTYSVDSTTNYLKVDTYFIPNKERPLSVRGITTNYRECLRIND
jgi:hypothetical protein